VKVWVGVKVSVGGMGVIDGGTGVTEVVTEGVSEGVKVDEGDGVSVNVGESSVPVGVSLAVSDGVGVWVAALWLLASCITTAPTQ
jgi:hypothetical protein